MTANPKTLFIAAEAPWPLHSGIHQRQYHLLEGLSQLGPVDLLITPRGASDVPEPVARLCRNLYVQPLPMGGKTRAGELWSNLRGRCIHHPSLRPEEMLPSVRAALAGGYDLVWIARLVSAIRLDHRGGANVVLDFDDIQHRKLLRSRPGWRRPWQSFWLTVAGHAWRKAERQALSRFARVVVCSQDDRRYLGSGNVEVIPNGVHVDDSAGFEPGEPGRMLFVGLMNYAPNVDAVRYFVGGILPHIRRRLPHARLRIVGSEPCPAVQRLGHVPGVEVAGFVNDLAPELAAAALSVVPLRAGGGTRIKILESLAAGAPVVSTSVGAEGLALADGREITIADGAEPFADACVALLSNTAARRKLAIAGRQCVRRNYAWPVVQQQVRELAADVVRRSPGRTRPVEVHSFPADIAAACVEGTST